MFWRPRFRQRLRLVLRILNSAQTCLYAAPAGTPQPILAKINEAMNHAVGRPDVKENLLNQAVILASSSPL